MTDTSHDCVIDTAFDFRSDTPVKGDPDARSPTLRRYHQLLWSKPLPSGPTFQLTTDRRGSYLYHGSALGEFHLASDAVIPTFRKEPRLAHVFEMIAQEERERFLHTSYTIGGMMLFPGNKVAGKMTINGARGCHPRIKDRFDLTVECIRRHYVGQASPLSAVLERYASFFRLFESFQGYVDFFVLNDLISADRSHVRFLAPFDNFVSSPVPNDLDEYVAYRDRAIQFIASRSARLTAS